MPGGGGKTAQTGRNKQSDETVAVTRAQKERYVDVVAGRCTSCTAAAAADAATTVVLSL